MFFDVLVLLLWNIDILLVLVIQVVVFWCVGLYCGFWCFVSVVDLFNIFKVSFIGLLVIVVVLVYKCFNGVLMLVLVIYLFVLLVLFGVLCLLYCVWKDYQVLQLDVSVCWVLILGVGQVVEVLVCDLCWFGDFYLVGLFDDVFYLQGVKLQGLLIFGMLDDVLAVVCEIVVKLLVIVIFLLDVVGMQCVVVLCESIGVLFWMVFKFNDILLGYLLFGQFKEVVIEDLFGCKLILLDWVLICGWLGGCIVLVIGVGGFIGLELCCQCVCYGVGCFVLLEMSELLLLIIEVEFKCSFFDLDVEVVLGDCGDLVVICYVLLLLYVDVVFYVVVYKQVLVLECQLCEVVCNNILFIEMVVCVCVEVWIEYFVFIFMDKVVDLVNVLGVSKCYVEMICQSLDQKINYICFVIVCFGNVLVLVGSVVLVFCEQIFKGGLVIVIDLEVMCYFMIIFEVCQLILQVVVLVLYGVIYILDMGELVLICVFVEQMICLVGKQLYKDIVIIYIGLCLGEKLYEMLFYLDEDYCFMVYFKILEVGVCSFVCEQVLGNVFKLCEVIVIYDIDVINSILFVIMFEFVLLLQDDNVIFVIVLLFFV